MYGIATATLNSVSLNSKAQPRKYTKEELSVSWVNMVCEYLSPFNTVVANGFVDIIAKGNLTN